MAVKQKIADNDIVYQIRITLNESNPPIWRLVLVSGNSSLRSLHLLIQEVMGWYNDHLHLFLISGIEYSDPLFELDGTDDERKVKLSKLGLRRKSKIKYVYDFGDSWVHTLLIEGILPKEPGKTYPVCLAGERACPPEDCGGIVGYEELLEIIANPKHPEYEEMTEWLGATSIAREFDIIKANDRLKPLQQRKGGRSRTIC